MRSLCLLAVSVAYLTAQTAAPNAAGISMGHVHMMVKDPDAQKKAWMDVFGAEDVKAGPLDLMKLSGAFITISRAMSNGGSDGSAVNHIGVTVKDYAAVKAKVAAAGFMSEEPRPNQMFAIFPEGVRIEIMEAKDQAQPVVFSHVHESVPDPEVARDWYVKMFSAMAATRRGPAATVPGGEIDFIKAAAAQAPTKGRALDHIGFEVNDLPAVIKALEAKGITMETPFTDLTQRIGMKIAYLVDPTGTRIELTEGLATK